MAKITVLRSIKSCPEFAVLTQDTHFIACCPEFAVLRFSGHHKIAPLESEEDADAWVFFLSAKPECQHLTLAIMGKWVAVYIGEGGLHF